MGTTGNTMTGSMGRPREHEPDKKTVRGRFGLHLRALMESRGWNHDVLSERCGLSRTTIYNYTSGQRSPSIDELASIARAFGLKSWGELDPANE
jgi:ribosome-binding protein aMBF1 (putative translation factor)